MGATIHRAGFAVREAEEGFQRAGGPPHRDVGSDLVELPLPFHVHGRSGIHYARYQRLFPRSKCSKSFLQTKSASKANLDELLQTAKTLNYISSPLIFPYFTFFIGVWIYLRHYINIVILHATLTTFADVGPFELDWDTQQYKCWISQYIAFGLLAALQGLNLFWLFFVLRIAYNIIFNSVVQDVRSDDEDSEAEMEKQQGEGYEVGISGGAGTEKKALENGKPNGVSGMNGSLKDGHAPQAEALREGKKER